MKSKRARAGLEKRALVIRLRRIKGQIEGIERMVEAEAETPAVLMQVVSARQAMKSFSEEVIESHLQECIEATVGQGGSHLNLAPPTALASRFAGATSPNDTYAAALFHTGWFVESLMTQTLIVHVIRTNLIPFIQSRGSWQLMMTTLLIMCVAAYLPISPLADFLGFVPLPPLYWLLLVLTLVCYLGLTQVVKTWLLKKSWI
jgi:DNA-binding FrmR family transcriptional regulator